MFIFYAVFAISTTFVGVFYWICYCIFKWTGKKLPYFFAYPYFECESNLRPLLVADWQLLASNLWKELALALIPLKLRVFSG